MCDDIGDEALINHVGRIIEINRYPVKSMAGERCESVVIDWQGIEGDRQYAFVRRGNATRFPWFTARDHSELVLYRATYDQPESPRTSVVTTITPDGLAYEINDPHLIEKLERDARLPLDVIQLGNGTYDAMPVSIVTTASLRRLGELHGTELDSRRFRANVIIDSECLESELQGQRLRLGTDDDAPELFLACVAPRCAMITINPDTAIRDLSILRTVARGLNNEFAIYASVAKPGCVLKGDSVSIVA